MRLIDMDALKKEHRMAYRCEDCERNARDCQHVYGHTLMDICSMLDDAPTVYDWISVNEKLPESGKHVLAACKFKTLFGKEMTYICEAFHADKHSISISTKDDDSYEYNEGEYYLKEGWYEVIHNLDEYSSIVIDDTVTDWMPLPEPPEVDKA